MALGLIYLAREWTLDAAVISWNERRAFLALLLCCLPQTHRVQKGSPASSKAGTDPPRPPPMYIKYLSFALRKCLTVDEKKCTSYFS